MKLRKGKEGEGSREISDGDASPPCEILEKKARYARYIL